MKEDKLMRQFCEETGGERTCARACKGSSIQAARAQVRAKEEDVEPEASAVFITLPCIRVARYESKGTDRGGGG